jgi:hypothetical protein
MLVDQDNPAIDPTTVCLVREVTDRILVGPVHQVIGPVILADQARPAIDPATLAGLARRVIVPAT